MKINIAKLYYLVVTSKKKELEYTVTTIHISWI